MSQNQSAVYSALLKPVRKSGRNVFPLDNRQIYTQKAGQIIPAKVYHFIPNDYFEINAKDFTITFPMQTAPFLRGRKEFSFYSVYYNAVWSLFNQYMSTRQNPKTSAFGNAPVLKEPRIKVWQLYGACFAQFVNYLWYDVAVPRIAEFTRVNNESISDANKFTDAIKDIMNEADYIVNRATLFNPIRYNSLAFDPEHDMPFDDGDFATLYTAYEAGFTNLTSAYLNEISFKGMSDGFTPLKFMDDIVGHRRVYNWIRKLDMLGYGNIYPLFRSCEDTLNEYYDRNLKSAGSFVERDSFFYTIGFTFGRLVNELYEDLVNMSIKAVDSSTVQYEFLNLYPICGYNSIFYHFFRNSYYDLDYLCNDYSLDFISTSSVQGNYNIVNLSDFSLRFLDIEYHQWKKDVFTGVLPDTQFGAVSSLSLNNVTIVNDQHPSGATANAQVLGSGYTKPAGTLYFSNQEKNQWNIENAFDVIALRRAEVLQDYRQQILRAGNKTSDVFKAIYGIAPSSEHEEDIIPKFMETFGTDIFVDPVIATSATGNSENGNLGDIAARAKFSGESKKIKFNAGGNFGCIFCLSYIIPEAEYNSYMLDKHLTELDPESHFISNFDKLGLEPIFRKELNMLYPSTDNAVLGYGPRYHHKKVEFDKVHGALCALPTERFKISSSAIDDLKLDYKPVQWFGEFNHWVSPRTELQNRNNTMIRDFYVNPSVLDNVFVRAAGPDQSDDQFICVTGFRVNSTRPMSKTGLINFV